MRKNLAALTVTLGAAAVLAIPATNAGAAPSVVTRLSTRCGSSATPVRTFASRSTTFRLLQSTGRC